MEALRNYISFQNIALLGVFLVLIGLPASLSLLSIGLGITAGIGLISAKPRLQWERSRDNKLILLLGGLYLMHFASIFWVEDYEKFGHEILLKLPLVLIPWSLTVIPRFSQKQRLGLFKVFVVVTIGVAAFSVARYYLNADQVNFHIRRSQPIKILGGINHIYFSIFLAFASILAFWIGRIARKELRKLEWGLFWSLSGIGILFLHILTARTGLVAFYLTILAFGGEWVIKNHRWKIGVAGILILVSLPFAGYLTLDSFQHRWHNTIGDVQRFMYDGDINNYSISMRLESWKTGLNVCKRAPILGVGMSEVKQQMYDQYEIDESILWQNNRIQPHNQFLEFMVGLGIPGFLLFVVIWFYPMTQAHYRTSFLFKCFWMLSFILLLGESAIERELGIGFYVIFLMLLPPKPAPSQG